MRKDQTTDPLVSIIICSYNSSGYILETLESAKAQTYANIELIVSDDCSTDNTVDVCKEWINNNKERFAHVEIITVEKNTGITANVNRGFRLAKGKWLKTMAADDIFLPDCIEQNMRFVLSTDEDISFVYSRCIFLIGNEYVYDHPRIRYYNNNEKEFNKSARGQFLSIIKENFACPPTVFMKRDTLVALNGFDESFYQTEDTPLLLKATSRGIKLHFQPEETVIYRYHDQSLSQEYYNKWVYIDEKIINKYFKLKYRFLYLFHYLDYRISFFNKKRVIENKSSFGKLIKLINPLAIIRAIKGKFVKS